MIELEHVSKIYRVGEVEIRALDDVSLTIADGEMVAIMGASGSGKSTLMNVLGCLDIPTSGRYLLDGVDVSGLSDNELARIRNRKIGFVFQSFNLLPRTSAARNVELPLVYAGASDRGAKAQRALERVGLGDKADSMPNQLSGGQQQRVAVARALVTDPGLLLADEPTGNLDTTTSIEIVNLLVDLNKAGHTVVIITHEEDIAAFAGRILRLRDGRLVSDTAVSDTAVSDTAVNGTAVSRSPGQGAHLADVAGTPAA
ncbi:MAG TPA: ABC transporter ATP-binding protein [Pseudonocardia sp.]|nr:ABC transporter ATP-binding protein [Pseudonocardia sp.]